MWEQHKRSTGCRKSTDRDNLGGYMKQPHFLHKSVKELRGLKQNDGAE